jgi:hypothetical protein
VRVVLCLAKRYSTETRASRSTDEHFRDQASGQLYALAALPPVATGLAGSWPAPIVNTPVAPRGSNSFTAT